MLVFPEDFKTFNFAFPNSLKWGNSISGWFFKEIGPSANRVP